MFSRNQANLDSAAHFLHGCGQQEDRIEKDVSRHHNDSAGKKRARHIPLRLLYFADDVGRGIPARVRIHDINEGDREGAAEDRPRVAGLRQKSDRLFLFDEKSSSDEHANQKQLHDCPKILKGAAKAQVTEMEKRHDPNEHERKDNRGTEVEHAAEIFSECHGSERNGCGEAHRGGNETSHETDGWVINFGKKMIFATGARQGGAELAIANRAAQRRDPAHNPEHQ